LEVGILRAVQKRRHELLALRWIGIGKIRAGLVGRGEAAYEIEAVVKRYWLPLLNALAAQIAAEPSRGVLRIIRPEEVLG
jgi:hypothetical protein